MQVLYSFNFVWREIFDFQICDFSDFVNSVFYMVV